jgi:DNA-binding CsgD family transcriptional regulator
MQGTVEGRDDELREARRGLADRHGIVLVGRPGVGKTALATVLAEQWDGPVLWVRASTSLRSVPFAALTLALAAAVPEPTDDGLGVAGPDSLAAMRSIHAAIAAFGAGRDLLLFVDDAHQLDDASATVLHQLVLSTPATVLLTMRADEPHPEAVHRLWRDELCERVEVGPLSFETIGSLAAAQLGGPVERDAQLRLHKAVGGNPLFLRELLHDAQHAGTVEQRAGLWTWHGRAGDAPRLSELVTMTVGRLPEDEQDMLQTLALSEVLPIDVAERLAAPSVLVALEARSLVAVDHDADASRTVVRLGHPIFGEVFRPPEGSATSRRILRDVVLAFGEVVTNPVDLLRLAEWRLEIGVEIDPFELTDLAQLAFERGNPKLAERLGRLALEHLTGVPAARAGVTLGEVLIEAGRHAEADEVLAELTQLDLPAPLLGRAIAARLRALCHALGQFDLAAAEVAPRIALVDDPLWHDFVTAQWATVMARNGLFPQAMATVEPLRDNPEPLVRLRTIPALNTVLIFTGRADDGLALAESCVALALDKRREIPFGPAWVGGALLSAAMLSGRLDDAQMLLGLFEADPLHHLPQNRANAAYSRARLELLLGNGTEALRLATSAVSLYEIADTENWRAMAIGVALEASGHVGDALAAAELLAAFDDELVTGGDKLFELEARRGASWGHVARGDAATALSSLRAVADEAAALGITTLQAIALQDIVRLAPNHRAAAELHQLTTGFQGERFAAIHTWAGGHADDDPATLEAAAERFEQTGLQLFAAESFAEASRGFRRRGVEAGARRTASRAAALRARFPDVVTPSLIQPLDREVLTAREAQIARLAADGLASKAIAEQLHLSVRTVEGHLGRAYDKLGVRSRAELVRALG